jgi:multiple sugar transport system substrate-binding protein
MRDIAQFFTRPPHLYGFAPFTQVSEGATVEALWVLHTFGTRLFDEHMEWALDDIKATAAFEFYLDMLHFAPPGASAWHHGERMGAYRRGQIAQIMTWPIFFRDLENPRKSAVVGRSLYALPPAGPAGARAPVAGSWTLAIPRSAHNAPLAAEFAAWWTSRAVGYALARAGLNPLRLDLLTDPTLLPDNPWYAMVQENLERATLRPRSRHYRETSDLVSRVFSKLVSRQLSSEQAVAELKRALMNGDGS